MDASTPVLQQNYRFGPWSSVRLRLFGHDMLTPIPDALPPSPPTPRSQPGPNFFSQQQAADLLVTVARLQSDVVHRSLHRPLRQHRSRGHSRLGIGQSHSRIQKSQSFCEVTSWDQYRQVFDAIVRSNGWDDDEGVR